MTPPGRVPSDQAVRKRAASRLGTSCLLEAGAGTGKTTVLLDRVKEVLKTNVPLERIAVITFTEKAAGELKLRLRKVMEEMLEASAGTGWGEHLRRSLESLDRATVCTIHAFAASLLRERPVEANVDPRFSVADPIATAMLMEETWDRWVEAQMTLGSAPLARALRLGVTLEQIRDLAFALVENRDVAPSASQRREAGDVTAVRDRILHGIEQLQHLSGSCVNEADAAFVQIRALAAAAPGLRDVEGDRLLLRLEALPLKGNVGAQDHWRPAADLARAKELVAEMGEARERMSRRERAAAAHDLGGWIRSGFLHAYRAAKERLRLLDFADLLLVCRNMLRDSPTARRAFQSRFDCLLVDEFQDTDPLQAEILFLLAAGEPEVSDWRHARPRRGKLFLVGDPKQSIYRFRRADIEIYEESRALVRATGGLTDEKLVQNFRAVPSIVSWVNELFGRLIQPKPGTRWQPDYEPIVAWREEPRPSTGLASKFGSRVVLLAPTDPQALAEAGAETVRLAEARHVVALVRRAVEEGWPVHDRDAARERPIRYADVALLFRTSAAIEIYEDRLRESSVPYRLSGGRRYYLRAEMRALQAVLWAIESPHDPLAVVSALRSPILGHSDEDLLTYKAAGGDWVYTKESAGRGTPFEKAFALLARLHASRHDKPVAGLLEEIYESTGALSLFYLKPDGEQRVANLLQAIDLARAHQAAGGVTFGSFVRWLSGMATQERETAEAPLVEETTPEQAGEEASEGDAVRVMTVHKAKGLEHPMTILCDPGGQPRNSVPPCVVERGPDVIEFSVGSGRSRLQSAGYEAAHAREKQRLEAERCRLFYVAATRARDYLVVPLFAGRRSGGIHAMLIEAGFLPTSADAVSHRGASVLSGSLLDTSAAGARQSRAPSFEAVQADSSLILQKDAWHKTLELALRAPPLGREFRAASAMERLGDIGRASVAWRETAPGGRPGHVARGGDEGAGAGRRSRALGLAVHAVLERIDLATGRDIDVLSEEEAARFAYPELAGEVRGLVRAALGSAIVREALAAPRRFSELPFAAAGDTYLTEGRVDLAFESDGALTLVDYKTDDVRGEPEIAARVAAYEPQAQVYVQAVAQATGLPVSRVVLLFVRPGVERSVSVDEKFLSRARRLVEGGAEAAGR